VQCSRGGVERTAVDGGRERLKLCEIHR
jgi:hypothetical protein